MIRRRSRLLAIAAVVFFVIYLAYVEVTTVDGWLSFGLFTSEPQFSSWRDVQIRHPVRRLKKLPSGRPKHLSKIQHDFGQELDSDKVVRLERRQAIKDSFMRCYKSYVDRAWMQDELSPVTGEYSNLYGGWAATLVDSLDTLWIMGMKTEFDLAVEGVANIDFSSSTETKVNIFETTIRHLGGLLSAYDLSGNEVLRRKAIEVGEMLLVAFDTPNHMPVTRWDWLNAANGEPQVASDATYVAELGSLSMEFTRLSQITQDMRWYDAVARITKLFASQQTKTKLPGLWPVTVDAKDQDLTEDIFFSLGGSADSLYEYFPKMYALLGGLESTYQNLYRTSTTAAITHLLFRPMTPENYDILFSGDVAVTDTGSQFFDAQAQHLGCFTGGMFALGSRLFNIPSHLSIAQRLVDGCIWAYNSSARGIMPELIRLTPCEDADACPWDEKHWHSAIRRVHQTDVSSGKSMKKIISENRLPPGIAHIRNPSYHLRPEAIESIFLLYRITGLSYLPDQAWTMFTTIQNLTETEYGNAELEDISYKHFKVRKKDRMESFWMAETLKYFYLIFSETDLISLDEYVFNTEAHPFRRPLL